MTRWLKISLVVIVGCGFLAMMIYALVNRDEISSSQIEPPLITPPAEPLKRRPDQPGGMQIPNRDKMVFDLLDSSNTALGATGVGTPFEEEDAVDDVSSTMTVADLVDAVSGSQLEAVTLPAVKAIAVVTPVAVVEKPVEVAAIKPVKVEEKKPEVAKKEEPVKVEPKAEKAEPKVAGGKWGVQLAAVNSVADGNAFASKVAKEFMVLKNLKPKVSAVPGGGKYRVQFVGFASREAAADVCSKLKGKQGCFPVSVQ